MFDDQIVLLFDDQIGYKFRSDPMQILIRSHADFFPIRSPKIFAINCMHYTACTPLKFHRFSIDF